MAHNLCTPQNIFGPFRQHLFLGCSVMSFTANVGWGQQSSELTVQVVEDTCTAPEGSPKIYWDALLQRQETYAADPGFYIYGEAGNEAVAVGASVYFRVEDFEFAGLVQSWEKNDSPEGKNVFTIKIVSPTEILDGCQLILSGYQGSLPAIYNIFNVYGFLESIGTPCADSPSGGFGGSDSNNRGIPINKIRGAINVLTSSVVPVSNGYSPFGRIVYRNEPSDNGFGVIGFDIAAAPGAFDMFSFDEAFTGGTDNRYTYLLDISDLPVGPDYYRFGGTSMSIMDFINQVCDDAGCDYYVELMPILNSGKVYKFIKIRTVSRNLVPNLNTISAFLSSSDGVLSSSVGREARNEINSSFLIGGQKESMFTINSGILPYYGLQPNGDAIIPVLEGSEYKITIGISQLNRMMNTELNTDSLIITESEIRMAAGGYDAWLAYIKIADTNSWQELLDIFPDIDDTLKFNANVLQNIIDIKAVARDVVRFANAVAIPGDDQAKKNQLDDIQKVHRFVQNLASEYYGKKFMVPVGDVCVKLPSETIVPVFSYEPVSTAWHDETAIFGMNPGSAELEFFSEEDEKVNPILKFPSFAYADFENRNESEYGIVDNVLYYKGQIEPQFVFEDVSAFTNPYVVVAISDGLYRKVDDDDNPVALADIFRGIIKLNNNPLALAEFERLHAAVGGNNLEIEILGVASFPTAVAVPLRSNTQTYGPWYTTLAPAGKIRIEQDESLVPWEYGSTTLMNSAANSKVTEGVTNMVEGETGTINIAGYPTIPLGAELGATYGSGGFQLVENRVISVDTYEGEDYNSFQYGAWTGSYGPNITGINVSVSTGGVTTSYTMRTFTPQFGRFTKQNAERLKQIGKNGNKVNRLQKMEYLKNNKPPKRPPVNKDVIP